MKKYLLVVALVVAAQSIWAQMAEVSKDHEGNKVIKGFMNKEQLTTDTAFAWFEKQQKDYTPYKSALQTVKDHKDSINYLVFGGTWCHDSQFILPRFYSLTEAAGVEPNKITVLGVDRNKKTVQNLSEAFNITLIPTIIVLKGGKEIGRVTEYGKVGMFDKELGDIIKSNASKSN